MDQDIVFKGNFAFVTNAFLYQYGISQSIIDQYTTVNCPISERWFFRNSNKKSLIAYESISNNFKIIFNLPTVTELLNQYRRILKSETEISPSKKFSWLEHSLLSSYNYWDLEVETYENEILFGKQLERFCKTIAVLKKCLDLIFFGAKTGDLYLAYICFNDLVYIPNSHNQFCNDIRSIDKTCSIEELCIEGLCKIPLHNDSRSVDIISNINKYYLSQNDKSVATITRLVNRDLALANRKPILLDSVQKIISQPFISNSSISNRFMKNFAIFHKKLTYDYYFPTKTGELWIVNCSNFNFNYIDKENNVKSVTLLLISDGASGKIIGFSYGNKGSKLFNSALKIAFNQSQHLPNEIAFFDSNFLNNEIDYQVRSYLKMNGVGLSIIEDNTYSHHLFTQYVFGVFMSRFCLSKIGNYSKGFFLANNNLIFEKEAEFDELYKSQLLDYKALSKSIADRIFKYNSYSTEEIGISPNNCFKTNQQHQQIAKLKKIEERYFFELLENDLKVNSSLNNPITNSLDIHSNLEFNNRNLRFHEICNLALTQKKIFIVSSHNYIDLNEAINSFRSSSQVAVFYIKYQKSISHRLFYSMIANKIGDENYKDIDDVSFIMKRGANFFNNYTPVKLLVVDNAFNFTYKSLLLFFDFYQLIRHTTNILIIGQISLKQKINHWEGKKRMDEIQNSIFYIDF